jgi:NADH-quinone oxidoreductase subunit G
MPKITVDGQSVECRDKVNILQACTEAGMELPQYCYHPGLSVVASCRICLVEVEGIPKLVPSCQTPIREGMVVNTKTTKVTANQKQVMEYLLVNHPLDCPVCDQAGECHLQDYSYKYGRSQSRFEEDKLKKPKKDVGEHILLYNDRCIMCTRCVRFTREIAGTSELYVDGRGSKEQIDIFPGKPLNNKLSGNVVDLCPVGALLDKDFLFKQRVWLLKNAPSISPTDSGGENIYLCHNENAVWRVKPRYNAEVNGWWISDDTRYSYQAIASESRIKTARKLQYGSPIGLTVSKALEAAVSGLKSVVAEKGAGSLYAVLSPMMSCEEAYLLATFIRGLDGQAVLALGPVPAAAADDVFKHYLSGKETFRIQKEKVPNKNGILKVLEKLGGPTATLEELAGNAKLAGGWIVGGYLSNWVTPSLKLPKGFKVLQDTLATSLTETVDVVIPSAFWAEKEGTWINHAGKAQVFTKAIDTPEGVFAEGEVYHKLLERQTKYAAADVRAELGEGFAELVVPTEQEAAGASAMEFAEL